MHSLIFVCSVILLCSIYLGIDLNSKLQFFLIFKKLKKFNFFFGNDHHVICLVNSSSNLSPRIVGGNITTIRTYPFTALVYYFFDDTQSNHCAGSIIGDEWILTAAHCIK